MSLTLTVPPELQERLTEALQSGRFFITISYQVEGEEEDLRHHYMTQNYPREDLLPTLERLAEVVKGKELRGVGSKWK